jgi:hypothetical protein
MTLKVVGAGVGRTGTHSLKLALETLLGEPCYHMVEVFGHPEHIATWGAAVRGEPVDWDALFAGYAAAVDWPAAGFWRELSAAYPEAIVLLSMRESPEVWWRSANATIYRARREPPPQMAGNPEWLTTMRELSARRFTADVEDEAAATAAYSRHIAEVRAGVPAGRLVEWRPGDGWNPLCDALGVPVPDMPFPHTNTTAQFEAMLQGTPLPT